MLTPQPARPEGVATAAGRGAWASLALFLLAALGLLAVASTHKQGNYAYGCDAYGYLRQARLFRENGLQGGFDTRLKTEEARFLIEAAQGTGLEPARWLQMVAPHCHHYKPRTGRVALQYPPGTGLFLALLPVDRNVQLLYLGAIGSVLLAYALVQAREARGATHSLLLITGLALAVQAAMSPAAQSSYSVPLTLGLCALAALATLRALPIAADRTPNLPACAALGALCGLLILVRIPNVFVVLGVGVYALVRARPWTRQGRRDHLAGAGLFVAGGLACGALPLAVAHRINAGHVFSTTYAPADASPARFEGALAAANLRYYLAESSAWPVLVLALAVTAYALFAWTRATPGTPTRRHLLALWLALAATLAATLAYFLTHDIKAPYYALPAAFFALTLGLFGLIAAERFGATVASDPGAWARAGASLLVIGGAVAVAAAGARRDVYGGLRFPAEAARPEAVVWSDLTSGTLQFHLGKYAAKLNFGEACVQDMLLAQVAARGRPQYLVADSDDMARVLARLQEAARFALVGHFEAHARLPVYRIEALDSTKLGRCP